MRFSNGFLRGVAQCCCCCTLLFSVLTGFFILCKIKTRFATCDRPPFDADRSQKKSQKVAGEFVFEMGKRGRKKTQRCRNGPSFFWNFQFFYRVFFSHTTNRGRDIQRRFSVGFFLSDSHFFCHVFLFIGFGSDTRVGVSRATKKKTKIEIHKKDVEENPTATANDSDDERKKKMGTKHSALNGEFRGISIGRSGQRDSSRNEENFFLFFFIFFVAVTTRHRRNNGDCIL